MCNVKPVTIVVPASAVIVKLSGSIINVRNAIHFCQCIGTILIREIIRGQAKLGGLVRSASIIKIQAGSQCS